MSAFSLSRFPAHLGLGATTTQEPEFTGAMEWYMAYGARHAADGIEGRLVTMGSFTAPWPSWEMHPKGAELVVCTEGEITLIQEIDGAPTKVTLKKGEAIINPPGVWHTADVAAPCTCFFVTAGAGTEHRPR
jgi:quercetin dioxygenase-like cupin family protein